MESYTSYVLSQESRDQLAKIFPPKYPEFLGHHVTVQFGVPDNTPAPEQPSTINVIGYVDSGDGLEVLVVSVNGSRDRPDGGTYHITWSLDRAKYKPVDSNILLSKGKFTLMKKIPITVTPKVLQ